MAESPIFRGEKSPLLFGHRGCPKLAPENNLSSFKKILEFRVPGVELDVQICRSGELVVYHDNNMKRTTGFDGYIVDHDLTQIRSLDNGSFFSEEFKNEKIPLFEEVLQLLGDKVYYDIELKADYIKNRGLERKVLQMIKDFHLENRVLISSFNPVLLRRFRKLSPTIPLSLIYSNSKEVPPYFRKGEGRYLVKTQGLKPDCKILDKKLFDRLKSKYNLMTWTVDDEKTFRKLQRWGISGICSNRADFFASGKFVY
ncbi:MAG: glycerophosphodiester phosphodiesterase [Spirochaetaceae bacterium]|nr:glycerophosphodiester phosphodiesterase [Spirochaetaceae bacterium]